MSDRDSRLNQSHRFYNSLPKRKTAANLFAAICLSLLTGFPAALEAATLENGFEKPPNSARLRAYWWWLNGNVTKAAITRDLEQMKEKGFGGALICDAGGAEVDGNDPVPHGPTFFTPAWRALYQHALNEARQLGLEMSLSIQSGWDLGGPMVSAEDAVKKLTWSQLVVTQASGSTFTISRPEARENFYRDLFVVAYPRKPAAEQKDRPPPIQNWEQKAMYSTFHFSAPSTAKLFEDFPATRGEEDTQANQVLDLTAKLDPQGILHWDKPAGDWVVLRFGCTLADHPHVSTCSEGWNGYALDVMDAGAFKRYWDAVVEPLIADAGPIAGKTLKYLHTDSWEIEAVNWTPTLRDEFRKRRGYDLLPFLPVLAGKIVNSRLESDRFLNDFRKTLGDLAMDNHYRLFREGAHRHGLLIHPESGGPHGVPIDAQRCLGMDDAPMSEFWAWSWRHRIGDENRFFVKQPASAAHTYGHQLVLAEGFTTIGPHWQERIWDNLKPSFDKACCEGLNMLVWHAFVCSPEEMGLPGQQYFAGTHFNPNSTWWEKSAPFLRYINRCQFLLQQGNFVADVCYYYGDHVPNFAQLKASDPARVLPGYDYDVATEETVLNQMSVKGGRITLSSGMNYRVLVLPDRGMISLPVLRKLKELVAAGATVIGPKPTQACSLQDYPRCDTEIARLAEELWGKNIPANGPLEHSFGKGRIISGKTAREVLLADGIAPDFEFNGPEGASLDYIHRRTDDAEIYFICNRSNRTEKVRCAFRVSGRAPELWDAVTGEPRFASSYNLEGGRAIVPLEFPPCGSWFVLFRAQAAKHPPVAADNTPAFTPVQVLDGAWEVEFDPARGGPGWVKFDRLTSWTERDEPGVRFYSGTASYLKRFDYPRQLRRSERLFLDLGDVHELADVRLNGEPLGIVWTPPFRVDITDAVNETGNELEIEVVNFWPNRIIGDADLPPEKRLTRTNIRKLTRDTPLMVSGILGPVQILSTPDNASRSKKSRRSVRER